MDDLEQIRAFMAAEPAPGEERLAKAEKQLAASMAADARSVSERRKRWMPGRAISRRWALVLPAGVLAAVLAVILVMRPVSDPDLGMRVTSYSQAAPTDLTPHLLDNALAFSYLPAGFHLAADTQSNKVTRPAEFRRAVLFQAAGSTGPISLTVSVDQMAVYDKMYGKVLYNRLANASITPTVIRGHVGEAITSPPPPAPRTGLPWPPCGPPRPGTPATASQRGFATLIWIEQPGVRFDIQSQGLSLAELTKVAAGIGYHPGRDRCLVGRTPRTAGPCAPGTQSSPPSPPPGVPSGGTEIGAGTVNGRSWLFSAAILPGNAWFQFSYGRGLGGGGSCTGGPPSNEIDVFTALDGQRFATGMVPDWITAVTAKSPSGSTVRQPVLPRHLAGQAFFALSLGKFHGVCDDLCRGKVTIAFYRGSTKVGAVTVGNDVSFGGFGVRGKTSLP